MKKRSKEERKAAKAAANRERELNGKGKRARQAKAPAPPAAPAVSTPRPTRRCATFAAFEAAMGAFMATISRVKEQQQGARFKVTEVPLPPKDDVLGAALTRSATEWRSRCRRALLLWHPDKWAALAEWADDAHALAQLTQTMTRAVLRAKERGHAEAAM